eukprot:TRINITY_DN28118_c0_g1_i1.p2 TRINITY_DN28118_c0_g1~~TRINITY_DN28118_c0_g1_i1.p2  ORF type:complete len:113 (+),score=29.87 TRINITY_DN28118_c0_g1_i1:69-407(+)
MHAEVVFLDEIQPEWVDKYIRTVGRVVLPTSGSGFDVVLELYSHSLPIDTELLDPQQPVEPLALHEFMGTLKRGPDGGTFLQAETMRLVNGLDVNLYRKAIEMRRVHLEHAK